MLNEAFDHETNTQGLARVGIAIYSAIKFESMAHVNVLAVML